MLHSEKHTPKFGCGLSSLVAGLKKNATSSMHFQKMQSVLLLPNFVSPVFCAFGSWLHFFLMQTIPVKSLTQFL